MKNVIMKSSVLGLIASTTVLTMGCAAGSDAAPGDDNVGSDEAKIVAFGAPIISGCNVSQMYDVWAPSSSNIGFVAFSTQNLTDNLAQLYAVNQAGNQFALNTAAQQTSAAMQSFLNQALSQSAVAQNSTSTAAGNSAFASNLATTAAQGSNITTATNAAQSSGFDTTVATHAQHADAFNSALANANQSAFNTVNQFVMPGGFTGFVGGFIPGIALPFSSFVNTATSANVFNAATNATSTNASTADTVAHNWAMQAANQSTVASQSAQAATTSNVASAANQTYANAFNLAQNFAQQNVVSNSGQASQAANFVSNSQNLSFNNLATQNLSHVRLLVNSVANSSNSFTNVFTGMNQTVFATGGFPIAAGGCL